MKSQGKDMVETDQRSPRRLLAWVKDAARTGDELASVCGRFPEVDRVIASLPVATAVLLQCRRITLKDYKTTTVIDPLLAYGSIARHLEKNTREFLEVPPG